jgi:PAS domain S-box-containing protein
MTIRKKMILILLASTTIPMFVVGVLGYFHARKTLESVRMEELKSIADLKVKRIEDFFAEHQKHIAIAQQRPTLMKYSAILTEFSGDLSNPIYADIRDELDRALKIYLPVYKFINVILTNPDGRIAYILNRSSTTARYGAPLTDFWGESFDGDKNKIQYSRVFKNTVAGDKLSIFLMGPIRSLEGQLTGYAAFEIGMGPIYELLQDTTGLGKSGETLIVKKEGDQALFLNPLRHDPDAALKRRAAFGESQAIALQEALNGNDGGDLTVDYRGQKVLAAWRYIPSLGWGMVTKIDLAEYEPVTTLRDFGLVLVITVIVFSVFAAFIVAKFFSDPIQALQKGVREIGKCNLDHKVATDAQDEIGQLGRAFDQMTGRLKLVTASRDELDKEIKERSKIEKELQKSMDELSERIKELNCLFEISRLVERRRLSFEEILQGIVELIPPAWQYSEITCAKIHIEGQEFRTVNFKETPWMLSQNIIVFEKTAGRVGVCYLEERPQKDEGPFLREERGLIDAIAERIGRIAERRKAQTALVESEKRFRDLVEHSLTGISIIQDGQIVYQNPKQESLLGPLPRPIKLQDTESIHPNDITTVDAFYQSISVGKLPIGAMEFRFYPSGEKASRRHMKWVHCQASRIEYQGKDAILMNMMDMTKTKELEHLLTIQDKMASLGRVAAGIAHEIRNPLSGINIYLNTLGKIYDKTENKAKVEQIIEHLKSASSKIESVIRRVMDFAKPGEPRLELIDINKPLAEAIKLTAVTMRKSNIKIEQALTENLPPCLADSHLIEEMVLNLINNAAEAMRPMEANKKICVGSALMNNAIVITVSDSGPGVPGIIRDEIFDPFYTTKHDSTGIGLSLCQRIASDHGGSFRVGASEMGGADFRIEIPLKKAVDS